MARQPVPEGQKLFGFYCPDDLFDRMDKRARHLGITKSGFVRMAISKELDGA